MSQYIQWETGEPIFLASDADWEGFVQWGDLLHDRLAFFPQLSLFIDEGNSRSPVVLLENLERASVEVEPNALVAAVIETLRENLGNRGELRSVSVVSD